MKITKSQMREIFPKEVLAFVETWMKENHSRNVTLEDMTGRKLYFGEDCRYIAFRNEKRAAVECGGEWGGYRKNDPINTYIEVPVGTWVVETRYFLGYPACTVMNWGDTQSRLGGG